MELLHGSGFAWTGRADSLTPLPSGQAVPAPDASARLEIGWELADTVGLLETLRLERESPWEMRMLMTLRLPGVSRPSWRWPRCGRLKLT